MASNWMEVTLMDGNKVMVNFDTVERVSVARDELGSAVGTCIVTYGTATGVDLVIVVRESYDAIRGRLRPKVVGPVS